MTIYFNSRSDFYSELSNFAPWSFKINGTEYKTMEHYYQSQKFMSIEWAERILEANTAVEAKQLGSTRDYAIHGDWDQFKVHVTRVGLRHKFMQNPHLKRMLISTGDEELVHEASWDSYWGNGRNGKGKNVLGILLMELRDELKGEM